MTVVSFHRLHPLRPLGLAVSLELNCPHDLLAALRELPGERIRAEDSGLFEALLRGTVALARCASQFNDGRDPPRTMADPLLALEVGAAEVAIVEALHRGRRWQAVTGDRRW